MSLRAVPLAALLAAPAFAAVPDYPLAKRLKAIVQAAGLQSPGSFEPAPALGGPVSGSGLVSGGGSVRCSSLGPDGSGTASAWILVEGDIPVSGPGGAYGRVRVRGSLNLHGSCRGGSAYLHGSGALSGADALYVNGRPAGRAQVYGTVFYSRGAQGGYLHVSEYVNVSGTLY